MIKSRSLIRFLLECNPETIRPLLEHAQKDAEPKKRAKRELGRLDLLFVVLLIFMSAAERNERSSHVCEEEFGRKQCPKCDG